MPMIPGDHGITQPQGHFNITEEDIEEGAYGYSYPYYPFDDVEIESMVTGRSDVPDVRYVKMWS
jgi:hypothetical protein